MARTLEELRASLRDDLGDAGIERLGATTELQDAKLDRAIQAAIAEYDAMAGRIAFTFNAAGPSVTGPGTAQEEEAMLLLALANLCDMAARATKFFFEWKSKEKGANQIEETKRWSEEAKELRKRAGELIKKAVRTTRGATIGIFMRGSQVEQDEDAEDEVA